MALLIPQGKQDTTQDNKFNPITANDVMLEITELKLAKTQANTLEVTLRILDGQHKNRFVFDRVTFDPNSPMSWKYRQLRKCAGVPYQDNEPATIDIEALLLHKAVKADLGIRKGKNKDGEDQEYQDIKYKIVNIQPTPTQPGSVFSNTAPAQTPTAPATTPKKTTKPKATAVAQQNTTEEKDVNATKSEVVEEDFIPVNATPSIEINDEDDWD
jgi:hypothetical protein